jgi:hypothetical protein
MVSGIDLLAHTQESLNKELVEKIPDIEEVTYIILHTRRVWMYKRSWTRQ